MNRTYLIALLIYSAAGSLTAQPVSDSAAYAKANREINYLVGVLGINPVQADSLRGRLVPFYHSYGSINLGAVRVDSRLQQMNTQHRQALFAILTPAQKARYDSVTAKWQRLAATRRDSL